MNKRDWTYKKLSEVCHPKKDIKRASKHYKSDDYISYIDISSIDNKNNVITETTRYAFCDAPSRAQQIVCSDDVIISMVRPNLKNIAMVREGSNLVASSGFCVLRSRPAVNPSFLFSFVKSTRFTNYLISRVSGANYPAVRESDILNFSIPLPSMEEQEAIVAELDEINEVIAALQQQVADLDTLAQSTFYDMFGDPVTNPNGWDVKKLGSLCTIERGGSPRPIKDFITEAEDGINWIKIGDAKEGSIFIDSTAEKIKPEGMKKSRFVRKGDFILSNSMSFGRPYILRVDGCIHDGWLVIRDDNHIFDKYFLFYFLSSQNVYKEFKRLAVGGVVNNLNSSMVRALNVFVPPITTQQEFANKVEAIESAKVELSAQITEMQNLLASRMDYFFD